ERVRRGVVQSGREQRTEAVVGPEALGHVAPLVLGVDLPRGELHRGQRYARGRPSTRSAMMLRWISLVPPGIVAPKLRRYWIAHDPSRHIWGPNQSRSSPSMPSASM